MIDLKLTGEDKIQAEIIQWSYKESKNTPELWMLYHVPNGGWRGYAQGMRFKALGVKSGYPDLALDVARREYHGLRMEVKTDKGVVSDNQKEWHRRLKAEGYFVVTVRTAEEGIEILKEYIK